MNIAFQNYCCKNGKNVFERTANIRWSLKKNLGRDNRSKRHTKKWMKFEQNKEFQRNVENHKSGTPLTKAYQDWLQIINGLPILLNKIIIKSTNKILTAQCNWNNICLINVTQSSVSSLAIRYSRIT